MLNCKNRKIEKISVIVTVYNRMEHLRTCFLSLLNQSIQPYELIIADDGSNENVMDTIGDLIDRVEFKIKHVYQEDLGFRLSRSRNNGAKESEGDFLLFLDQDIIFGKDYIKTIVENCNKSKIYPFKVLWSTYEEKIKIMELIENNRDYSEMLKNISEEQKKDRLKENRRDKIKNIKFMLRIRKKATTVGGASFALFKEDYIKVNGFDENFIGHGNEDLDFGFRLQKSGVYGKIIDFEEPPIHLNHQKEATFGGNQSKIEKIKKEPQNVKLYSEYGYDNTLGEDKYRVEILK